jgi:hypothetical protein
MNNNYMKKRILCLVSYYENDFEDKENFAVFVANPKNSLERQFLVYANEWNDWKIKKKNIIDIFVLNEEEDNKGRKYKIIVE